MHRTTSAASSAVAPVVALLALLTACGNAPSNTPADAHEPARASTRADGHLTAGAAFRSLSARVRTATPTGTVTAENDPNHLLGRPGEYTSKVTFSDSWVQASQVTGADPGAVERGGAVEVFADASDARARAEYIRGIAESSPALAEYDYVHGPVLVRVSRYLTPKQAAQYESAAAGLG
ncbi:hypothetical protein [Streptomyces triticiradicis]|uniref:Lipoprotein n=1 Tax=Streptomyces triticiradicis TaxID=2651189 RepID=A0A7J5DBY3_9ACTN|nr:hypothetical protein [Streptomyces triticiradicis]KAB1986334.1 hypothetical protein F8144_23385 [Streptomyces triticiradicis]